MSWDIEREWYEKGVEGLFNEGEEEIAKDWYYSYLYAYNKLKGRFIAGEKVIRNSSSEFVYIDFLKKKGIEV